MKLKINFIVRLTIFICEYFVFPALTKIQFSEQLGLPGFHFGFITLAHCEVHYGTAHQHHRSTSLAVPSPPHDHNEGKSKGKFHPITGQESPEGEQMFTSTLPLPSALGRGGCSTPSPGRFSHEKDPVPIV
jgi:hypothetical protein